MAFKHEKILISLLILSLLKINIYAESYSIPLSYEVEPNYIVTIPSVVDVSENETSFKFSVCGDIYYDYSLQVIFDETTTIYNGLDYSEIQVIQNTKIFNYQQLANGAQETIELKHDTLQSGKWSGSLNLTISLKGEQ